MDFSEFHFLRPWWLTAFIALAVFLYFYYHQRIKQGSWTEVCDPQLLDWLLVDKPLKPQQRQQTWLTLAGIIAILALAGPAWERAPVPVFRNQSALVIILDLSQSMYATDLKPNRITRARFKITDILKQRKDGQSALIVYSDAAFVVTPLSNDAETIIHQLNVLEPSLMPGQGNNSKAAIQLAAKLFRQTGVNNGQVLLLTDGGDQQSTALEAIRDLAKRGHQLSILGVGTETGAPIPLPGGFVKDARGSIVIPRINHSELKQLAEAGNGIYQQISSGDADIKALLDVIEQTDNASLSTKAASEISQWKDRGPWLVLLLIPFAALAFRKGYLLAVVLLLTTTSPETHAMSWDALWRNADQIGQSAFNEKRYEEAASYFTSPQWKAAALYRAGQYQQAEQLLKQLPDSSENRYNLGNTQAKQNKLKEALESYQQALKLDPDNQDAQYNKKIVEEALKQQQQNQDQKNQSAEKQDSSEQKDQQQSESKRQQNKDQQQSDKQQQQQSQQSSDEDAHNQAQKQSPAQRQDQKDDVSGEQDKPEYAGNQQQTAQPEQQQAAQADDEQPFDEADQATEQWMRRIPDDPGRLLRRKFLYQYKRNNRLGLRQK